MGCRSHLARGCRESRQVLGSRVRYCKGPRTMGRRAAEHVETDPAGSALVSWREPATGETLLLVPGPSAQGSHGRDPNTGLRASRSPPPQLAVQLPDTMTLDVV